ncbi:hypothetical protein CDL15_Pgr009301 [Punica granatum]|uniref:RRM domain-containing protein n=1 Tax=Punica granatum TaxID=22663 RepID=A0A218XGK4_PUNGR|nr:hypothetical protein CDL15_Pgr009301 [Punica granatum]
MAGNDEFDRLSASLLGFYSPFWPNPMELFAEVGDIKRYSIHYDRSERSKGTAEVVFSQRVDAIAAVKRYNNVQLDGKPMKIEIVGTNIVTPAAPPLLPAPMNSAFAASNGILIGIMGGEGSQWSGTKQYIQKCTASSRVEESINLCGCGRKLPLQTSTRKQSYGRRFLGCPL